MIETPCATSGELIQPPHPGLGRRGHPLDGGETHASHVYVFCCSYLHDSEAFRQVTQAAARRVRNEIGGLAPRKNAVVGPAPPRLRQEAPAYSPCRAYRARAGSIVNRRRILHAESHTENASYIRMPVI
jgi:hypothetical protein